MQVFGDRGLADVAGLGRPTHAPLVEDGEEQFEAMQSHCGFCHKVFLIYFINISSLPYHASPPKLG
jgi:hypothetical protein